MIERMQWQLKIVFPVLAFMLNSCSSVPQEETGAETMMDNAVKAHEDFKQQQQQAPQEISDTLLSNASSMSAGVNTGVGSVVPKAERFDISVNNVPARTFFLSLVADSGTNVVAHPEVSGVISLELNNVSINEVLDVTRDVYGYEYKYKNGIYTIYPRKLRTDVFPINYLDVKRVGITDTGISIGKIGSSGGRNRNNSNSRDSDEASNLLGYLEDVDDENSNSRQTESSPGTRIQTLNRTDFWGAIKQTIKAIVGGEQDGRMVMVNPQAGLVVVKALPNELSAVREFLERSELSVKRQVVLETKILEVKLNDEFEAGIDWGAISGDLSVVSQTAGPGTISDVLFRGEGDTETLVTTVLDVLDITQLLKLLETQGNVQVLSSPRISTVNNQKAIIRVGSDEFFVTGVSNNTTTSASAIQNIPEIELESFFSGIALDVTPQIAEDGDVILHVHPVVSKVQDQVKDIDIGDEIFSLPLALRDVRESDSIVRAQSGQVVVLGGLMQESTIDVFGKRPVLGDIPLVNSLFRTREKQRVKTELVILMRPIVVDEGTWEKEVYRAKAAIGEMSESYRTRAD